MTNLWVGAASGSVIVASLVDKVGVQRSWLMLLSGLAVCIQLLIKLAAPAAHPRKAGSSAGILAGLCSGPAPAWVAALPSRGGSLARTVSLLSMLFWRRGPV